MTYEHPEVLTHPWRILVLSVLARYTNAERALGVALELFRMWPNAAALAKANPLVLERLIEPLGRQQMRAVLVRDVCEGYLAAWLRRDDTSWNPSPELTRSEIEKIPGVGPDGIEAWVRYVDNREAGAVMNCA